MADTEKLHFKIGIGGTYWKKVPIYSILINDKVIQTTEIVSPSGEVDIIEFDADIEEGPAKLQIRLENKDDTDVIQSEDKTAILQDLLLNIKTVEIDEIDLGNLVFTKSEFVGDDSSRPVLDKCVDLGWNGTWTLPFESPFYIWLLENI
jgi:hypothetical protein